MILPRFSGSYSTLERVREAHCLRAGIQHVSRSYLRSGKKTLSFNDSLVYASLFYAEYEVATRALRCVKAGHNAPMVLRWKRGQCEVFHLESSGTPLGLLRTLNSLPKPFHLKLAMCLSRARTESQKPKARRMNCGEWSGLKTYYVLAVIARQRKSSRRILDEVTVFANGRSQRDDVTLLVFGVKDNA